MKKLTDKQKIIEYLKEKVRKNDRIVNCIEIASNLNVSYFLVGQTIDELIKDGSLREIN